MMNNLAALLQQQTKSTEAEALFREVLEKRRKILAESHPQIADSLIGLGTALMESRKPHEAEPLLREGLDIRRRKLAKGHARISGAECVLGACLADLGRHSEAESLLLPAYESLDRAAGATPFEKRKALDYVVGLYESWKQPEKAAAWRAKREDSKK
jgi:tetratricopeptide (TPR) repeat protein